MATDLRQLGIRPVRAFDPLVEHEVPGTTTNVFRLPVMRGARRGAFLGVTDGR